MTSSKSSVLPRIMTALVTIGMLMIAAGIVLPLLKGISYTPFRYIYAAGAAITLIGRLFSPYRGNNIRLKRLYRIESWSAVFFCVAAFFLFYSHGNMRDTLAFTLAGGIIQIYTSIMIPRVAKKSA